MTVDLRWLMCDKGCLYSEKGMSHLNSDPPRCIKHGEILEWRHWLYGLDRKQAQEAIRKENNKYD